jgi:hypothetical protein
MNPRPSFARPFLCAAALVALAPCSRAGSEVAAPTANELAADSTASTAISSEFDVEAAFINGTPFERGSHSIGSLSETSTAARFVLSPQLADGSLLRFGAFYNRTNLALPARALLPNTLQSAGLIVGADLQFDSILLRIEADPGFSGDNHASARGFNVPFIIGGAYIVSPDLQWILALSVDFNRPWVVIPAPGVRWRIGSQWVLNAVLPKPELEYEMTPGLTLHAGAALSGDTYRVGPSFGTTHGKPALNNALLTTEEVNLVLGATWQLRQSTLRMDAGYAAYRKFDYHRANVGLNSADGAVYLGVSLETKF